jgi:RNA polymerase sigma-70 factor (ECF subfamily)
MSASVLAWTSPPPLLPWANLLMSRLGARTLTADGDPDTDDVSLVRRAAGGDRRAFDRLHERHVDDVWRRLTRLLGPDPEREDLTQQIFMEVFHGLARFRGDATFRTYLHRVVVHMAADHLGRRRRRPLPVEARFFDETVASDASPEVRAEQRERLALIWAGLDGLKPKKRVAFLLRTIDGLSLSEIGELVGAPVTTVAKRVKHAEDELNRYLARRMSRGSS